MPGYDKLVEPTRNELIEWFNARRNGDRCHIITQTGETYTLLTRLSPTMVKWQISGFTGQDTEISNTMRFEELIETWHDFAVQK